jgi:hypothetical protein
MQLTSADRALAAGIAAAHPLTPAQRLAGREFRVQAITALGVGIDITQRFANHFAAQDFAIEAAGDGGAVVEVSPVIEVTYLDGRNAHRHGRECHQEASEAALRGWRAGEDAALAGDRTLNADKGQRMADRDFAEAMRLQLRKNGVDDLIGGR